jgi:hypothetical protein
LGEIVENLKHACEASAFPARLVNGTDSNVALFAVAKGRSPSLLINGLLREHSVYALFARKQQVNVKVPTKDNPSDDPSRNKPLRPPQPAPEWLEKLLQPEDIRLSWRELIPRELRCFREGYAGSARLTSAHRCAGIPVGRPLECHPMPPGSQGLQGNGCYVAWNDLNNPDVVHNIACEIIWGVYGYMHFGIDCAPWGQFNTMNGGTRTSESPLGSSNALPRETKGNEQLKAVIYLCRLLHLHGCLFSIENPLSSFIWKTVYFLQLVDLCNDNMFFIDLHMCAFNLQLPGAEPYHYCRKATRIACNFYELKSIRRVCPGLSQFHRHDHAMGSILIDGQRYSKAKAAGCYSVQLCAAWAAASSSAFRRLFWKGHALWSGH